MLQASQRVDDFEIIRLLGKGGMGEVYEAQQLHPARRVALKVLAPWMAQDDEALQRFRREVEVLAQLDHPGIVHVITTGKTPDGLLFYTMKLIRGVSLADLIKTTSQKPAAGALAATKSVAQSELETPTGIIPPPSTASDPPEGPPTDVLCEYLENRFAFVARVGLSAARALAAAHNQGHLHRDIKPSNLMIDHHGQLYLVDFGLTRALDPTTEVSRAGTVRGTPWYMSPEQAAGAALNQRSDIYSLGVSLYMLATQGMGPFTANRDDSHSVLDQVRAGMHLPLRALVPDIPHDLERIILRAMQLKPKRRYQNAAELANDLELAMPSASSWLTPSKSRVSATRPVARRISVRVASAAILVTIATVFGVWSIFRDRPKSGTESPSIPSPPVTGMIEPKPEQHKPIEPKPDDYPVILSNAPPQTVLPLLKSDFTPLWPNHRFLGSGFANGLPTELMLMSPPESRPTMFALADSTRGDPKHPWFEFTVELRVHAGKATNDASPPSCASEAGIFWGLHPPREPERGPSRFFTAKLQQISTGKNLQTMVSIGTSMEKLIDEQSSASNWNRPLVKGKGILKAADSPDSDGGWHQLRLRVQDFRIRLTLDAGAFQEFETSWLPESDPWLKDGPSDPRGLLGFWVSNGAASFRSATFMPLP